VDTDRRPAPDQNRRLDKNLPAVAQGPYGSLQFCNPLGNPTRITNRA
jgi:hypothetical protein